MVLSTMEGDKTPNQTSQYLIPPPSHSYLGLAVEIDCG